MKRTLVKIGHPDEYKNINKKQHLREMAYSTEVIIQKLLQYDDARLEHLLKLYYYKKFDRYIHTWMNTVYKCTIRTYKDKTTNKLPTFDLLCSNLWENQKDVYKESHDGFIKTFNATLKSLPKIENYDIKGSAAFCENYYKWLAQKLSTQESVSFPEVEDELKNLLGL